MYNLNYTPTTSGVQSWREIISGGKRTKKVEYHCSRAYRPNLRPTLYRIHWVGGGGGNAAEVNNSWRYTPTPPHIIITWCLIKHRGKSSLSSPADLCVRDFPLLQNINKQYWTANILRAAGHRRPPNLRSFQRMRNGQHMTANSNILNIL
jgi:hypothetical protein